MSTEEEKVINVPLSAAVKERLDRVADLNGRATNREAAWAIAQYVRRFEQGADWSQQ